MDGNKTLVFGCFNALNAFSDAAIYFIENDGLEAVEANVIQIRYRGHISVERPRLGSVLLQQCLMVGVGESRLGLIV